MCHIERIGVLYEILKKRLGDDKFAFSFDTEKDVMHLDHKMLERGMEIGLGKILSKYEEKKEIDDELQKSIIGSLADNVVVSIKGGNVHIVISKEFK